MCIALCFFKYYIFPKIGLLITFENDLVLECGLVFVTITYHVTKLPHIYYLSTWVVINEQIFS